MNNFHKADLKGFSILVLLLVSMPYSRNTLASIEHWVLSDVKLSDGGIVAGRFDFDTTKTLSPSTQEALISWSITVTGGNSNIFPDFSWNSVNTSAYYQTGAITFVSNQTFPPIPPNYYYYETRVLDMYTRPPLEFVTSGSVALTWLNDCYNCDPYRSSVQGSLIETVATVPIPSSIWLFSSALAGFGMLLKRRLIFNTR